MEKKFAKGPWYQVHSKDSDGMHTTKVYNQEYVIARFEWCPVKVSETVITTNREANAKLCAAAPDLLRVAELVISMNHNNYSYRELEIMAKEAIAKALS
jgi:hypothetical protein